MGRSTEFFWPSLSSQSLFSSSSFPPPFGPFSFFSHLLDQGRLVDLARWKAIRCWISVISFLSAYRKPMIKPSSGARPQSRWTRYIGIPLKRIS